MKNWLNSLYVWISKTANTKMGPFALFLCAFADASFLPIPVTTFFLVLILLNTRMIFKYIFFVVLGTLTGAILGYSIGHFAWLKPDGEFRGAVQFLFDNIPGFSVSAYEKVHALYSKLDFWILCVATTTPLPYSMFSITSGVFDVNIFVFIFTTLVCQTIKYTFLAVLISKLGPEVKRIMKFDWKPAVILTAGIVIIIVISSFL
jgi:membrane protein YqaA with SNARE-associated domain